MVDSINNNGVFDWQAWFQSEMPAWAPANTALFMKQETDCINSFHGQIDKLYEDSKKAAKELEQE